MPCRSDYLEPTERERESREVANHILHLHDMLQSDIPKEIPALKGVCDAAKNTYGNIKMLDEYTGYLCSKIKSLPEKVADRTIYNGRNRYARRLADWWEEHQRIDRMREAREKEEARKLKEKKRKAELRDSARKKLTKDERKALGI